MRAQKNVGYNLIAIFCGAIWVATGLSILYSVLHGFEPSAYSYVLGGCSLMGIVGATALVAKLTWGRYVFALAPLVYLLGFGANFYTTSVGWQLEDASTAQAIHKALSWRWQMIEIDFQRGRSWQGVGIFFYEFVMPLFQLTVLFFSARSLTFRSNGCAASGTPLS